MPNTVVRKRFGNALRQEREAKGLSQEALGFESGLHRTYVSSVERGERNVSLENIVKFGKALGVSGEYLLKKAGL
jgi:transcriptional regulator with XRE-family HTH domain